MARTDGVESARASTNLRNGGLVLKRMVSERNVEFADCDSARIVFYPNFYIWFDRATERLFASVGLTYQAMELRSW